jgi:hypothetical protein
VQRYTVQHGTATVRGHGGRGGYLVRMNFVLRATSQPGSSPSIEPAMPLNGMPNRRRHRGQTCDLVTHPLPGCDGFLSIHSSPVRDPPPPHTHTHTHG